MTETQLLLPCNLTVDKTLDYPSGSLNSDTSSPENAWDEVVNLPQINTVLPNTTYRVNYFIQSKKKRLFRLDKYNRGIRNSRMKSLIPDIRRHGFLKNIEVREATKDCCDVFKIGLMSGKKEYDLKELKTLLNSLKGLTSNRVYLKDNFAKNLFINRDKLSQHFVNADFNIFKIAN